MKETKVYVDGEFPQVYFDPKTGNECIEGRPLILEDIKTHDREFVAKVFEKIKSKFNYYELVDEIKEEIDFDKMKNYILDHIQKECEK